MCHFQWNKSECILQCLLHLFTSCILKIDARNHGCGKKKSNISGIPWSTWFHEIPAPKLLHHIPLSITSSSPNNIWYTCWQLTLRCLFCPPADFWFIILCDTCTLITSLHTISTTVTCGTGWNEEWIWKLLSSTVFCQINAPAWINMPPALSDGIFPSQ